MAHSTCATRFGERTQSVLYCVEEMQRLSDSTDRFSFVPVLSHKNDSSDWKGKRGLVTGLTGEQGIDIPACQAYLCGPPTTIDAVIETLHNLGLDTNQIFFDKFLDSSHLPGGRRG